MTSAHESPQTILQQICSPEANREDVAVVVRLDDGNLRLNPRDSCFEEFLTYLHPKVAIKACTPALNSLLAATGSTASLVDVGDGIELPIYDSLASVPRRVASQAAAIIRDVPALVVWSDDADSIAQWFLHVEHRIRHSTRMCSCAAFPSLTSDSSRTASNSDSTQGDDCLLTSSSGDESIDWFLFDEPSVALSELEVPLAVAPSFDLDEHRDGGVSPPQIRLDGNGSVTVDISTLHERLSAGFSASDSLLPLSSSRSSDLHPTSTIPHEQQTISPMLLQSSTYTPDSATLSPLSPSYAPLCSVYTAASPLRTPSTITLDIDSDSPAMKASSPESGRELDADWTPPRISLLWHSPHSRRA
ncbi:uncharacterized protein B0H18DRAFT_1120751 [Fomitopsis serialis]|uniref:uncharacterized protein n=1 Tax=Fomitopsis serialis TaxID=139415 RepID=UPI002008005F|nr:uncharacterized protein B0H18DRAFT_1120751 [Neoantrodia serialis]KAH9922753.1 hypothetical protein B0H18DRAFT_1120751 [Neoantrodia serialis]